MIGATRSNVVSAQESQRLKKSIARFLGLVGILVLLQGIVIAMHPDSNDVELGNMMIVFGLFFSFGAWRLWPASTSENIQNSNEQELSPPYVESFPLLQRISKPGFLFIFSVLFILIGLVLDDAMASSNPTFPIGPTNGQIVGILFLLTGGLMFLITGFIISRRILKSLLMKSS